MSRLVFQNEAGKLCIGGGAADAWRMTDISGLGLSGKTFQTAVLSSEAGQRTIGEHRSARIITLAGDVYAGDMTLENRLSRAVQILDQPGWLTVRSVSKNRRIWARCNAFELGDRIGKYRKFQMQFYCDSPYFEESGKRTAALFEREKKLKSTFTLPCVMSSRVSKGMLINGGDVEAEPVFEIYFGTDGSESDTGSLELINHSTGKKLVLSHPAEAGEKVTVDIASRKIYNQEGENLLSALSDDSFLSGFVLRKGKNELEVINHASRSISVVCGFSNKYLEAAY